MIAILSTVISILAFRFRRRASLELELIGLRHQVSILRRQHPGRIRLFSTDRLLTPYLRTLRGRAHCTAGRSSTRDTRRSAWTWW
jgi:hypothetical protein